MTKSLDPRLPDGWKRPTPNTQLSLFPMEADNLLVELGINRGDVRRWQELGWISFDIDTVHEMNEPELWEMEFVRNIARSGLTIRQINELLDDLRKPYRYDPINTTYHFAFGWVTPAPDDPFEVIERNISDWITHLAEEGNTDRLKELADEIGELLEPQEPTGEDGQ